MSIKQQIIDYRNSHKDSRILLGVILGEFEREEKAKGRTIGEVTDAECITIIKKLIQSNNECNVVGENEILELFIPQQLTEVQIENVIKHNDFHSIADCMKYFKLFHAGLYDGKLVSKLFNQK